MIKWENNTECYNPEILFVFEGKINGVKEKFKYHCHDFIELSIIIDGVADYYVEGSEYTLRKGHVLISNPGTYHKVIADREINSTQLHIAINKLQLSTIKENFIDTKGKGPILTLKKYKDEFFNCCREIVMEQEKKEMGHPLMLKALIMKLLIILCREIEGEEAINSSKYHCSFASSEKRNMVQSIVEYMEKSYKEEISLDTIAKNMYVSPVYISKIFKEEVGDSPINYLIKIRLAKAEELLKESTMSIKAVAKSVGYSDAYHFSKLFKKYYGVSPSQVK